MTRFQTSVREFAHGPLLAVDPESPIRAVNGLMEERGLSALPVVNAQGKAVGVISRTDLLRIGRAAPRGIGGSWKLLELPERPVSEVMHKGITTVEPDTSVMQAASMMVEQRIHRVYVRSGEGVDAVFGTKEVMRAVAAERINTRIGDVMSNKPFTVPTTATIALATDRLSQARAQGVVVIDPEGWPVGLFTQREALLARDFPQDSTVEDAMSHGMLCLHVDTPLHRAAAQAAETRARRVLAIDGRNVVGVVTGLDFARLCKG
jgi:CBS domain-containing protein